MNFYKRFIGDYRRKTARLSPLEHGMYCLLLDEYYATEEPLPLDEEELFSVVRARTDADESAVRKVLSRFWTQTPDGWTNERAGEEIRTYRAKSEKNREAAQIRWKNERDANEHANASTDAHADGDANRHAKSMPAIATSQKPRSTAQDPDQVKVNTACAEPALPDSPPSPVFVLIPVLGDGGSEAEVTEAMVAEWEAAFPAVDIRQQLRNMREWVLSNPTKRKTPRGVRRFITTWLAKEQDRGGSRTPTTHHPGAIEQMRRLREGGEL